MPSLDIRRATTPGKKFQLRIYRTRKHYTFQISPNQILKYTLFLPE